ncbi:MAG: YhfC family intramembrane metalloprotease [Clostridiales bacterium]|jgi:uncharacterized membrane protein YhfC|nr:YhfC family intramembrane metalloprotease [Clostridiales bacterium]MBQ2066270.1 YhfC family intramembrane metalloprotease [Clostridiales bacterium]MBQ4217879.1 YhfC family intramembrane metalloprotease [Clostridiales bacterium]
MVGTTAYIAFGLMIAAGLILPTVLCIWWLKTRHEKFTSVLTGAMTFLIFALVLESIVHSIVFMVFPGIKDNVVAYMLYGALMAGIFEETGRFLAYKLVLKKRTNRETAISYGIGHGGFEAVYILAATGINNFVYAGIINAGQFPALLDQLKAAGQDTSPIESLPEQLAAFGIADIGLPILERVFAVMFHIALSILVFYAVKNGKIWMYFLAVILHALLDAPAALYQQGVIGIAATEVCLALFSIVTFVIIYVFLYKRDKEVGEGVQVHNG